MKQSGEKLLEMEKNYFNWDVKGTIMHLCKCQVLYGIDVFHMSDSYPTSFYDLRNDSISFRTAKSTFTNSTTDQKAMLNS